MKMRKERADVRGYVREAGVRLQAAGKLLLGRGHAQHIPPSLSLSFNLSIPQKTATKVWPVPRPRTSTSITSLLFYDD